MKTAVIYKSSTGHTKKYAQWIAEDLAADLFPASGVTLEQMKGCDCIVFGGWVHAAGIAGLSLIKRNLDQLKGKRLIVFATGASPATGEILRELKDKNFTPLQQEAVRMFYFRGGFNFAALPFMYKLMMGMVKRMYLRKQMKGKPLTEDEAGMLELFNKPGDFTDRNLIGELVRAAGMDVKS